MLPEIHIGSASVNSYLLFYTLGALAAFLLVRREFARNSYPANAAWVLAAVVLPSGAVGGKLYYFAEAWSSLDLISMRPFFDVSGSGWYGGFLLGGAASLITVSAMRLPLRRTLDLVAPSVALAQVFGRLGCFLGGCCHGGPSSLPWTMSFPAGLYLLSVRVHPTQLYEALLYLGIFLYLWRRRETGRPRGSQVGMYLLLASIGRFLVEFVRINPRVLFQLTAPQLIAVGLASIGGWVLLGNRGARPAASSPDSAA